MTETFADAVERLQGVLEQQVEGWQRLLRTTREANLAVRAQDPDTFDRLLDEQVDTLRHLKELEESRRRTIREVGPEAPDEKVTELSLELRELAAAVGRQSRIGRLVIERNGALVEARLALHRRAGRDLSHSPGRVDRMA